jgi:hypothetical protein
LKHEYDLAPHWLNDIKRLELLELLLLAYGHALERRLFLQQELSWQPEPF